MRVAKKSSLKLLNLAFSLSLVVTCSSNGIGLSEMHASLLSEMKSNTCVFAEVGANFDMEQVNGAIKDFDSEAPENGEAAWSFLKMLSTSPTFMSKFWQSNPLLVRSAQISDITRQTNEDSDGEITSKNWIDGAFTVAKDLRLVDNSYISGSRTDDILRQGIKTDSWAFRPIKDNPNRPTTWEEVSDALDGGTIYFNSAGSFWKNLGALCRLSTFAFGLPSNVNIYITPPGSTISVPPHTDRQDVFVFQTEGSKRWRVYKPPKRVKGADPLNRGKGGDVLAPDVLGEPILDVVLRRGDMMYIPGGYPHETDTNTIVEHETVPVKEDGAKKLFDETSVHLTLGLDTHVWALTYAHVRWTLLQRCGKDWKVDIREDDAYWNSIKSLKVGFLADATSKPAELFDTEIANVKQALIRLEPERWDKEELPSDSDIRVVVEFLVQDHLRSLLEIQEEMYTNVNPRDDNTIIKGYQCTQKQNAVMQRYGEFSKNDGMSKAFEKRSKDSESKISNASM